LDNPDIWLALFFLIGSIAAVVFVSLQRKRFIAFGAMSSFLGGIVVVYVIEAIVGEDALVTWYGSPATAYTIFLAGVSVLTVYAGYNGKLARRAANRLPVVASEVNLGKLYAITICAVIVGVCAYIPLIATAGSFSDWLAVPRGGTDWEVASTAAFGLTRLVEAGALLQLFVVQSARKNPVSRILAWVLFAITFAWNFYLGTRSGVILLVVGGMAAFYIPRRRNPSAVLIATLFVSLYFIVVFQQKFRPEFYGLRINVERYTAEEIFDAVTPIRSHATTGVTDGIEKASEISCAVATVSLVPQVVDYNMGYPFLELFTRWVPRSIWPEKAYPLYEAITPIFQEADLSSLWIPYASKPILAGPALTFIGHWFAMGGAIVVLIAAYLTGILFWIIDSLYFERRHGFGGGVMLMMLSVVGFSEAAATPMSWVFSVPFALIPVMIILRFSRFRPKPVGPNVSLRQYAAPGRKDVS
jgi:uncharacterized membrane protein